MINKFKCDQTRKIWPSPLILSLYSTFQVEGNKSNNYDVTDCFAQIIQYNFSNNSKTTYT